MFKKTKQQVNEISDQSSVDTIMGADTYFNGKLTAKSSIRIDGKVDGEIKVDGNVYLGEGSVINANISCNNLTVAGEIHGNITLNGKLQITRTGKVFGDIEVVNLIINDGAVFKGNCKMKIENEPQKA